MPSGHQKQQLPQTPSSAGGPKSPDHWLSAGPAAGRTAGAVIRGRSLADADADAGDGPARHGAPGRQKHPAALPTAPITVVAPGRLPARAGPGASWRLPAARDVPRAASIITAWPRPSLTDPAMARAGLASAAAAAAIIQICARRGPCREAQVRVQIGGYARSNRNEGL